MPFTIKTHNQNYLNNQHFTKVKSDRKGYKKFEDRNCSAINPIKLKIKLITIFTFGLFYIYLKCSKDGKIDLNNLKNGRIIHYFNKDKLTNSDQKIIEGQKKNIRSKNLNNTLNKTSHFKEADLSKSKGQDSLNILINFIDDSQTKTSVTYDIEGIKHHAKNIITDFPFTQTVESRQKIGKIYRLLKKFNEFEELRQQFQNTLIANDFDLPIPEWRKRNPLAAEIVTLQRDTDTAPTKCVVLNGTDGEKFGIKIVSPESDYPILVLVVKKDGQDQEVCVEQEEFAERLQLDKNWISINDGNLAEYIKKENTILVLANYGRIIRKQTSLDPKNLSLMIKVAFKNREFSNYGRPLSSSYDFNLKASLSDREIVSSFRGDKLYLCDLSEKTSLAKGGEAEVFRIQGLSSKKVSIMKFFNGSLGTLVRPIPKALPEAELVQKLHEGHPEGRVPGIQKSFFGVVDFITNSGILMSEYEGNLRQALGFIDTPEKDAAVPQNRSIFNSFEEKLSAFYQPLLGFQYCVNKKGLIHQDIKPSNFLCKRSKKTGKLEIFLGDFGSASLIDKNKPERNDYGRPSTAKYVLFVDRDMKEQLGKRLYNFGFDRSFPGTMNLWKSYVDHCRSWDIFALGLVMAEFFAPGKDCMDFSGAHPKAGSFNRSVLEEANLPKKLIDLIESMVQTDPKSRPNIDVVLQHYSEILKECSK